MITTDLKIFEPAARVRIRRKATALVTFFALVGCASPESVIQPKLDLPPSTGTKVKDNVPDAAAQSRGTAVTNNPAPPLLLTKTIAQAAAPAPTAGAVPDVTLNFDQLPLPAFIQAVYATALKKNISVDPAVMSRKDLVTLRSGKQMTATDAESTARLLLKSYGVTVQDLGGLTRFVPDSTTAGYLPEIRRGRAMPDTPLPLRPIFQLVELQAVRNTEVGSYLRTLFGEKVRYTDDSARNALLLSGNGDDIQAAIEAIQVLDQPLFKGRSSVRISPTIWSAEELTKRLTEILINEGYSVGTTGQPGSAQFPITLLPVAGINSVVVLAQSQEVINHIVDWAKVLDKPAEKSVGRNFFSYQVRNTDASRLAETVQKLLSSTPVRAGTASNTTPGAAAATAQTANSVGVDKPTNTILFRASGEEYPDIIRLLNDLDRTARQVLIEVTIAEVKLTESMVTGVDWIFTKLNSSGTNVTAVGGNTGGSILGNALSTVQGLVVSQLDGSRNPRAVLQAEASDGRVTFLSNPKTLARNGETASIQVGDSIPILTQQQTNSATGGTGIISTVQYAETGTIMKIKPVIHSSDQVDLDITLESSQPGEVGKSGPQSPPISKRTLDTKLTLKHGSTYILGGLISNRKEVVGAGVPFLKDIPILGRAFKKDSETLNRTELIIMITPYIISDDGEARAVTDAVRKQLGGWAQETKPGPGTNAEPAANTK